MLFVFFQVPYKMPGRNGGVMEAAFQVSVHCASK